MNTHVAVLNTQSIASEIHRTVVERQATDDRNLLVSDHCTIFSPERSLTIA